MPKKSILNKYPQYSTLRGLVPDDVIEREISRSARVFEKYFPLAEERIKRVNLADVFPEKVEKESIHLENFLGHWGNASIEAVCKIALIVKFLHPMRIFEFGTYNGLTTLQMALNAPKNCIVYTLDLPIKQSMAVISMSVLDNYVAWHFRQKFGTTTGSYFKGRTDIKIVQLRQDSAKFNFSQFLNKIDIVFIDAAHDYYHKKYDSENAFKILKPGGVIIWDNYGDVGNPEVTRYLLEISGKYKLFHLRGTQLVIWWNKHGK